MKTVAIAGVGLIGGSFALALRQAGFRGLIAGEFAAHDCRGPFAPNHRPRNDTGEPPKRRIYSLAQPIGRIMSMIEEIGPELGPNTLVTDAGSTKSLICAAAAKRPAGGAVPGRASDGGKRIARRGKRDGGLFRGERGC